MVMDEFDTSLSVYNHTCDPCQIIGGAFIIKFSPQTIFLYKPPDFYHITFNT
jgi:hypothetical protein